MKKRSSGYNVHANKDDYYWIERENPVPDRADQPTGEGVSEPRLRVWYKYLFVPLQSVVAPAAAPSGRSNT